MSIKKLTFVMVTMVIANIFAATPPDQLLVSSDGSEASSKAQSYANLADLMGTTTKDSPYDQLQQAAIRAPAARFLVWSTGFFPLIDQAFTKGTFDPSIQTLCNGAFNLIEMQAGVIEVTELNQRNVSEMADNLAAATILQNNRLNNCADVLARWVSAWVTGPDSR